MYNNFEAPNLVFHNIQWYAQKVLYLDWEGAS